MKEVTKYFFMTLVIVQGFFIFLWYINFNFLGLLSWFGQGDSLNLIRFFLPTIIFGSIKLLYWIADPISKLLIIALRLILFLGIFYFLFWIFFL